jgi:hypothetical protein
VTHSCVIVQHRMRAADSAFCACRRSLDGGKAGRTARLAAVRGTITEKLRSVGEALLRLLHIPALSSLVCLRYSGQAVLCSC